MAKDNVKGDHNVFQAGSMMVKLYQINYPNARGSWVNDDEDFTEYEEVKVDFNIGKEEPNYFQTGRFLKRIINDDWFYELRTNKRFTMKWCETLVDDLVDSEWKIEVGDLWENRSKREMLKGYFLGCLKDAGVIKGSYDFIARCVGYEGRESRTFSRYMSAGKKQCFYDWIAFYVARN